jgi:hypothetical protein
LKGKQSDRVKTIKNSRKHDAILLAQAPITNNSNKGSYI